MTLEDDCLDEPFGAQANPLTKLQNTANAILAAIQKLQTSVTNLSTSLLKGVSEMSAIDDAITALTAQVAENTTVEESAVTLIQGIAQQIANNANDAAMVTSLSAQLAASASDLAAAISANTTPPPAGP